MTCEKPFILKAAKTSNKEWTTHQSVPQATLSRTHREIAAGRVFGELAKVIRERNAKIPNGPGEGIQHQVPGKTNQKNQRHQNQAIWAKHPGTNKKKTKHGKGSETIISERNERHSKHSPTNHSTKTSCIGARMKKFKET